MTVVLRTRRQRLVLAALLAALAVVLAIPYWCWRHRPSFDLLIRDGFLVDPAGDQPFRADIGITRGKVAAIGDLQGARAARFLDARGWMVAPGFVDTHTHIEGGIAPYGSARPVLAENFLRQGVTTVITGNCGRSALPLRDLFGQLGQRGVAVNVASLVGHGSIRRRVLGEADRAPSSSQLAQMEGLVVEAMRDGSLGLSAGLEYAPGTFASESELAALARHAGRHSGLFVVHLRTEGTGIEEALEEALRVSDSAAVALHLSHLKPVGPHNWGRSASLLARLDERRRRGARITQDLYPYTASSTDLSVLFSRPFLAAGGGRWRERLRDPAFREQARQDLLATLQAQGWPDLSFAQVAYFSPQPRWNGRRIRQIAQEMAPGDDPVRADTEAVLHLLSQGGAQMIYHNIAEADADAVFASPWTMVGSDSNIRHLALGQPHPRGSGSFPRYLRRYVREQKRLTLPEAVRRLTQLPAETFGLNGRGCLQPGCWADLVAFDLARLADHATYDLPLVPPDGIRFVLVNGVVSVDQGGMTGRIAGKVLRRNR